MVLEGDLLAVKEILSPGMKRLAKAVRTLFSFERLILIFGVLEDKDFRTMFRTIAPLSSCIILTTPLSERALPAEKLEALARAENRSCWVRPDIKDALSLALSMADRNDMIVGTGSIYFVGELLRLCRKSKQ